MSRWSSALLSFLRRTPITAAEAEDQRSNLHSKLASSAMLHGGGEDTFVGNRERVWTGEQYIRIVVLTSVD